MHAAGAARELDGINLGDARRNRRAQQLVATIQVDPSASFPDIYADESELEAHYRLTGNKNTDHQDILAPHARASWKRAASDPCTLVVHDTTDFTFPGEGERIGLVRVGKNRQVFYAHLALAMPEGVDTIIHGLVGLRAYVVEKGSWCEVQRNKEFEELLAGSERWRDLAQQVRKDASTEQMLIHVMDREADDYALWSTIIEQGDDFVIRSSHNRCLAGQKVKLHDVLGDQPFVVEREVKLSRRGKLRPPKSRKNHPARDRRIARLSIRFGEVTVRRPNGAAPLGDATMTLSLVEVVELDPPEGVKPVRWLLLTSLPADTPELVSRIVDIYRKRWKIEEYIKSIKTGCAMEKRQAESLWTLLNTLALLVPVAWRLMALRTLTRDKPTAAATEVVDELELAALRKLVPKAHLPKRRPTVRHVMLAIAKLGGHLKSNGEPGWLVLGRGLEKLLDFTAGWRAAIEWMKTQSAEGEIEM